MKAKDFQVVIQRNQSQNGTRQAATPTTTQDFYYTNLEELHWNNYRGEKNLTYNVWVSVDLTKGNAYNICKHHYLATQKDETEREIRTEWAKSIHRGHVDFITSTLSLPTSNSTFSQPFKEKCLSEVMRIGSIFHLSQLWKAEFFILYDVIYFWWGCRRNLKLVKSWRRKG